MIGRFGSRVGAVALAAVHLLGSEVLAGPQYDSDTTRALVEKMAAAHGGYADWVALPAVELELAMYLSSLPAGNGRTFGDNWRHYRVIVEPKSSRALVDVPAENQEGYEASATADLHWRRGLTFDPNFQDPPHMLAWYHYAMVNLPFLSQLDGVSASTAPAEQVGGDGREFEVVKLAFTRENGEAIDGTIDLFIDPDSNRLAGWRQGVFYPLLPGDAVPGGLPAQPGMIRMIDKYQDVDGFVIPRTYHTLTPAGDLAAVHIVLRADYGRDFPEGALEAPGDAEVVFKR